jgi:AbiV family abortive infection protein
MGTFLIPWTKALEGCRLSIENAKRLAEDAEFLKQNNRPASAFSLSINAWEELGKAVLLLRYHKQKQDISDRDWFRVLCNHRKKRAAYVNSMDILYPKSTPPKTVEQLKADLAKISVEWHEWFDLEREIGVYVDWATDWRSPCRIGKAAFEFPFDSDYWASSVRLCSAHLESILPP